MRSSEKHINSYCIRYMTIDDIPELLKLYKEARKRMVKMGNPDQWGDFHPPKDLLIKDIETKTGYIVHEKGSNSICGAFALAGGQDPTYNVIEHGSWINNKSYYTIHHIASDGVHKGILEAAVDFARTKTDSIRIDTHEKNLIMRHLLKKQGFIKCGIIYVLNGAPRIAYQLVCE